jgi:hypothetical protein
MPRSASVRNAGSTGIGLVPTGYQLGVSVLEVLEDGLPVTEVAMRHGVSRQSVHTWLRRYRSAAPAGFEKW